MCYGPFNYFMSPVRLQTQRSGLAAKFDCFHVTYSSPCQRRLPLAGSGSLSKAWIARARWFALSLAAAVGVWALPAPAQTVFLDFNTPGQYTGNFSPWNDNGGVNGGAYSFMESPTGGVGGSGEVSVFQSNDTTAAYNGGSWDFSTNGAAVILSVLLKANGQTSGNKVQFGLLNSDANGLNNNPGLAFESYRFVPTTANTWSLREQYRTANTNASETTFGTVTVAAGRWYKFVIGLTNTSGSNGDLTAGCALYDYGTDGLTPGPNVVTFLTVEDRTGQDIARTATAFPAFRAFQNAGIDAWDNFLVYTPRSLPVFTLGLSDSTVTAGQPATFPVLADGPGTISYSWVHQRYAGAWRVRFELHHASGEQRLHQPDGRGRQRQRRRLKHCRADRGHRAAAGNEHDPGCRHGVES